MSVERAVYVRQNFSIVVPIRKAAYQKEDEQTGQKHWYVQGYASSTNIDRDGDRMSDPCVDDMTKQILGDQMTLFVDHVHDIISGIGVITQALKKDDGLLWIEARLEDPEVNPLTKLILHKLEIGEKIGLSIGGDLLDYHNDMNGRIIDKVALYEISAVGLPANADSFLTGSVFKSLRSRMQSNEVYSLLCKDGKCELFVKELHKSMKSPEAIRNELIAVQNELVKRSLMTTKDLTEELDRFLENQGVGPELHKLPDGSGAFVGDVPTSKEEVEAFRQYRSVQEELDRRKMEEHVGTLLSEAYGDLTDGRFSQCVDDMSGKVDDPEGFCNWEHTRSLGRSPGSDKEEQTPTMNTLQYTHNQTDDTYHPTMQELQRVHGAIKHECPMGEEGIPINPMGGGTTKCKDCP